MIKETNKNNILKSNYKHIAFPFNQETIIDNELVEFIVKNYWSSLIFCEDHEIGDVIAKKVGDTTFYAMICYSNIDGWMDHQDLIFETCINKINTDGEELATICIGDQIRDSISGVNLVEVLKGMEKSQNDIVLFTQLELDEIKNIITNKNKQRKR